MNTETVYTSMLKEAGIGENVMGFLKYLNDNAPWTTARNYIGRGINDTLIHAPGTLRRNVLNLRSILTGKKAPELTPFQKEQWDKLNNGVATARDAVNNFKVASVSDMCTVYTSLIKQAAAAGAIVPGTPAPQAPVDPMQQQQGATINDTNQQLINSFNKMLTTVTKANETQAPPQPEQPQQQQQPAAPAALPTPPPFKPPQMKVPGLGNPVKAMTPKLPKAASAASADKEFGEKFNAALDAQKAMLPPRFHNWFETRMTPVRGVIDKGRRQALYDATKEQYGYGGIAGLGTAGLAFAGLGTMDFFKKHPGLRLLASGLAGAAVGIPLGNDIGTKSYNRQMGIVTSHDRA